MRVMEPTGGINGSGNPLSCLSSSCLMCFCSRQFVVVCVGLNRGMRGNGAGGWLGEWVCLVVPLRNLPVAHPACFSY